MHKANKKMQQLIDYINNTYANIVIHTPKDLLNADFTEVNGCVLLNINRQDYSKTPFNIGKYYDRTDFEAFHNHIHLSAYIEDSNIMPIDTLAIALKIREAWQKELINRYPQFRFVISVSYNGNDSVLRFHMLRQDEPMWIDIDDLEGYKEEAVCVLIT